MLYIQHQSSMHLLRWEPLEIAQYVKACPPKKAPDPFRFLHACMGDPTQWQDYVH